MKRIVFSIYTICVFTIFSLAFAQDQKMEEYNQYQSSIRLGWATSSSANIYSIDALNLGFSFPMFYLLKNKDLSIDWLVNGYSPIGRRDSFTFDGAFHCGIGLNYNLRIKSKNSLSVSAYPIASYSFYKGNPNQFSWLAVQFDVKLPLIYTSNETTKLCLGLSYTSPPAFYKESRSNYNLSSLYLLLSL